MHSGELAPRALCAEFPNDNPGLHRGGIWRCETIGEPLAFEPPMAESFGPIEVVDVLPIDDAVPEGAEPVEEWEAPEEAVAEPANPFAKFLGAVEDAATALGATNGELAALHALFGGARMETVELSERTTDALVTGGLATLAARGLGRAPAFAREVLAWQAILRGESEDFSACASATLDEWAANAIARVLGSPSRAESLRKELRRRGVAAFGLVADAA